MICQAQVSNVEPQPVLWSVPEQELMGKLFAYHSITRWRLLRLFRRQAASVMHGLTANFLNAAMAAITRLRLPTGFTNCRTFLVKVSLPDVSRNIIYSSQ